jgi:hypothetical protein
MRCKLKESFGGDGGDGFARQKKFSEGKQMDENNLSISGIDADAPQRYFDTLRRAEYLEPERVLLLAVLEDAVHCYRKFANVRDRAGQAQFSDAERWIMGGGNDWIFAFESVCEFLRLDPDYVRRGLRESARNRDRPRHHARHRQAA